VRAVDEALARDGVVCVRGALDADGIATMERAFEWSVAHPSPAAKRFYPEESATFHEDTGGNHLDVAQETGIVDLVKRLWGVDDAWYFGEQLFLKEGGSARRTPWHQDTSYLRILGTQMVAVWISLDPLPKEHSLEFVRASHLGTLYNGSAFASNDDTAPLYKRSLLPRLPDIQAERDQFDILSWATSPGDVIVFHLGILHGGAGTEPGLRRRTLSLRFLGSDVTFDGRPRDEVGAQEGNDAVLADMYGALKHGDPFAPMLGSPL
jgi:ectoine hydroxylase-related dioxygenase (phytanoyl-CoA dioxygenase family)